MTDPSKVQRFWIPATFHFTRLSEESVEAVLASDYDVLRTENERLKAADVNWLNTVHGQNDIIASVKAQLEAMTNERDELTYRQQVIADTVGEENWSLRKQLATAQARVRELEEQLAEAKCGEALCGHDHSNQYWELRCNKAEGQANDAQEAIGHYMKEIATLTARCAQLEAALRTFARYVWDNEKKVCSPLSDDAKKWLVKYGDLLP